MPLKNIIVFGSHGKVGQLLLKQISQAAGSFSATAIIRNQEQAKHISEITSGSKNVVTKELNYNEINTTQLSEAIKGHDVVVFTAGSAGKDLLKVDLDGAVKTFEASAQANVKRVIIISAVHADNREFFSKQALRDYYIAKHYADRILISEFGSKLDYTILKPTALTDEEGTGKISFFKSVDEPIGSIPRTDVAKVILNVINNANTFGKSYDFKSGDLSIEDPATFK